MTKSIWLVPGVLLIAGGGVFLRQHQSTEQLRQAEAMLRRDNRVLADLRDQNQGLRNQLPPAMERERLRADRGEMERLRNEIAMLKAKEVPEVAAAKMAPAERSFTNATMPAASWRNAGRETSVATLETFLWAAAGGDIEALAGMLRLNAEARTKAEEILAKLPDALRSEYGTPERLIALLTAKDIPLGGAGITGQADTKNENAAAINLHLRSPEGATKTIMVQLSREADGWQLNVPAKAVENYGAKLLGQPLPWPERAWKP